MAVDPWTASSYGRPGADAPQRFPLSPQQRRLWRLGPADPGHTAQCALAIEGSLDSGRLERAVERVVARHGILRTAFPADGPAGPVQAVGEAGWEWRRLAAGDGVDRAGEVARLLLDERRRMPSLEVGPPLRLALVRFGERDHVLLITLPALCADAATIARLARELGTEYGGTARASEDPTQYGDVAAWQNEPLEAGELERAGRELWRSLDVEAALDPKLPFLMPAGSERFDPRRVAATIGSDVVAAMDACEASTGAFLLAGWQALLDRVAGRPRMIAALSDGRGYPELEGVLGPLARYLPLGCELDEADSFTAALARIEDTLAEAREWQDCFALEDVLDGDHSNGPPPFLPVCFEYADDPPPWRAGHCEFSVADGWAGVDRFRLRLSCRRCGNVVRAELDFDPASVREQDARQVLTRLCELVRSAAADPDAPLHDLRCLEEAEERLLLVELNQTARRYPADRCVHELVAEQASRAPDALAVAFGHERLSYAELDARANRLAHRLKDLDPAPETRVAVYCRRSPEMVVALLGVLKSGGAYVPIDATAPAARLSFLLEDAGASIVLTEERLRERLAGTDAAVVSIDADRALEDDRRGPPAAAVRPDSLAYVIYTSGSTGTPKGVMITHRGLVNYITWCADAYSVAGGDGAPVHSPIAFDLTLTALFGPLVSGRPVWLQPEEEGIDTLAAAVQSGRDFSLVKLTPSQLAVLGQLVPPDEAGAVRAFVVGGEALAAETVAFWREHAPATRIFNEYGPTETVVGCAVHEVPASAPRSGPVPIGRPIANTRLYVLGRGLSPAPPGTSGELYVGGDGVARGYLGRPGLTAERFVPDPFGLPGERLYRTGDLARYRPDGTIEFLDRLDRQVKIRGFRVEPGEIEGVLASHEAVRDAVITVRDAAGERRLVAYVTPRRGVALTDEDITAFLAERLPPYMVPADVVTMESLPLTPNGKVDVGALPAPEQLARPYVAPRTAVEEVLTGIFADVMELERVGVDDDFFEMGGQSMSAARVVFSVRHALQSELSLRTIFEAPTVASLAEALPGDRASLERTAELALRVSRLTDAEAEAVLAERARD